MDYREEFLHNCDSLYDTHTTVRAKATASLMRWIAVLRFYPRILNDHDKKRQIIQLELLYPTQSFISEALQRFRNAMMCEREREKKKTDSPCAQLLFSFTVLLSETTAILEKYCSTIAELVNEHMNWAIVFDMPSASYALNICHTLFSVSFGITVSV